MRAGVVRDLSLMSMQGSLCRVLPVGVWLFPQLLRPLEQGLVVELAREVAQAAPPYQPAAVTGAGLEFATTACGVAGWTSDARGARFVTQHPVTRRPFPAIPSDLWRIVEAAAAEAGAVGFEVSSCQVNAFGRAGRWGRHKSSAMFGTARGPLVVLALGSTAVYGVGGVGYDEPLEEFELASGDVLVLGGPALEFYNSVERVTGEGDGAGLVRDRGHLQIIGRDLVV